MVGRVLHRSKVPVPPLPVVVRVLVAVVALGILLIGIIFAPDRSTSRSTSPTIGEQETVRITGPTGKTIEAIARVDTGATASSIDEDLARQLGFDLENAEMVTVRSSLGREKRPAVVGVVQIAGQEPRSSDGTQRQHDGCAGGVVPHSHRSAHAAGSRVRAGWRTTEIVSADCRGHGR